MPLVPLLEHKKADFVLEKPENGKRLRGYVLTPIYEASTFAEKGVSEGKSAQKPRFCAREEQIAWEKGLLGVNKFPYPFGSHYNPDCVRSELALTSFLLTSARTMPLNNGIVIHPFAHLPENG